MSDLSVMMPSFPFLYILVAVLNVLFAMAVYKDAQKLRTVAGLRGTFLVGPEVWALAVLVGGTVAVVIYWAIHYSSLRQNP
jgi:hypothetical protein